MKKILLSIIVIGLFLTMIISSANANEKLTCSSDPETPKMLSRCSVNSNGTGKVTEIEFKSFRERPKFKSYWIEYGNTSSSRIFKNRIFKLASSAISNLDHTLIVIGFKGDLTIDETTGYVSLNGRAMIGILKLHHWP